MMKQNSGRVLLIVVGILSLGLAILGIFLPLLPTTPFLLLAAWCFSKSSKRFYDWLLNNKLFGNYVKNYHEKKATTFKIKLLTLALLWITIGFSIIIVTDVLLVKVILVIVAICVSVHVLTLRTLGR
jgi:uncharacterized protein